MGSSPVDDCYFYYYSSCAKGSDCPFRHCEAALGTETVCTLWREGLCYRSNCKFRHMESRINRSSIPCYWENQPGGCRKPHCVFFHHKDRSNLNVFTETAGLILPVSSQPVSPSKTVESSADNRGESSESHSLSPPHPIQPVVVSLGEGEESDTESAASTPIKIISLGKKISSPLKNASVPAANAASCEMDLGIKTLEQIRMEKIHRESEHFYNPGTTEMMTDSSAERAMLETMYDESNGYYPQEYEAPANELTSSDLGIESYQNSSLLPMEVDNGIQQCSNSPESTPGDLRHILKKKRKVPEKEKFNKEPSTKRIISLKKAAGASEELSEVVCILKTQSRNEDDIGFRVKTLDEIRREKEKRQGDKAALSTFEAEIPDEENDVAKSVSNLSYPVKGQSVVNKVQPDVARPFANLSHQVKAQSVESKGKPNVARPIANLSHVKGQSVESKVKHNVARPIANLSHQAEGQSVENAKLDVDKPVMNLSCQVKRQSVVKPEGFKRRLLRKPLEQYRPPQKGRNGVEENERMLERYVSQVAEESMSGGEDAAKNISQELIPHKEEKQSTISLKRVCDTDVPIVSKIRRTVTLKRHNIIRRKFSSNLSSSQGSAMDEDSSSQHESSDSQKESSFQTSELSVSSSQNGVCMDSGDYEKTEDVEMSEEKADNTASSSPSVPLECKNEKGSSTPSTGDEFDTLFLGTESDICLDESGGNSVPKAEDLFLEFEKIIQG